MGDALAAEVRAGYPTMVGEEWLLMLDLAYAANDASRWGSCSFDYMTNRASTCEKLPRDESLVRLWLDRLVFQRVLTYELEDDLQGVMYVIGQQFPGHEEVRPVAVAPSPKPPVPTDLYRRFDIQDRLLYIGITNDLARRAAAHEEGSTWMEFAVRSTTVRYPSRPDAEEAEETAIKAELPLFNHEHNDTPEARRRLVEYLIAHDRLDLLAPAVSRG